MDNAESLFRKLDLAYVQQEMIGNKFENNWLECKEKQKPEQGALDQGDKSNFAKALSGFANTSGGVLIFGLEARKDKDDVDQITGLKPIKELRKFESALRELESRIVERLVPGVEYVRIPTTGDEGLVAVYVPQSEQLPHRSQIDSKFYLRAGGVFSAMPVGLIEDLFARRLRPALEFIVRQIGNERLLVSLANRGKASAKNPYVIFGLPDGISHSRYELNGNTPLDSWATVYDHKGERGIYMSFRNGNNLIVHPDSEVALLQLQHPRIERRGSMTTTTTWSFAYHVYAENMLPAEGIFSIKIET
ncbi:helix-turn-helix domain-containing protein [Sorangium cellulosum]|uniref:AlbA family DNA-binding domain-containing protein n=1 Tax=Sorangium cellulosum TaxID=56 RepID=UPI0016511F6E|nr:ATP-binding protein [Sorangium cellulosum]